MKRGPYKKRKVTASKKEKAPTSTNGAGQKRRTEAEGSTSHETSSSRKSWSRSKKIKWKKGQKPKGVAEAYAREMSAEKKTGKLAYVKALKWAMSKTGIKPQHKHWHPKPTAKEKQIHKLLHLIFEPRGRDALKLVLTKITCEKKPSEEIKMPSFTLLSDQQIRLAVQPVKGSKPTQVDGSLAWEVVQGDAVKVLASPKGLKALIVPNEASVSTADTIVNVSGDADRGDGVKTIELNLTFLVVASQADAIEVVGEPVVEPLSDNPTAPTDDV